MKKLILSVSLLATVAAFADGITSAQTFGALPITVSNESVIVSVPWVASTNGSDTAISVSNIIKTANLTVGDTIRVWDNGAEKNVFNVWTLAQDDETGIKYWSGVTVVKTNGDTRTTVSSDLVTLKRGDALILKRNNWDKKEYTFYVYGQVSGSSATETITIAQGTATTPAYTLIASPSVADYNLNSATWDNITVGGNSGDMIYVSDDADNVLIGAAIYTWHKGKDSWGYLKNGWNENATVKAGRGCWYVSRGANSGVTVKW